MYRQVLPALQNGQRVNYPRMRRAIIPSCVGSHRCEGVFLASFPMAVVHQSAFSFLTSVALAAFKSLHPASAQSYPEKKGAKKRGGGANGNVGDDIADSCSDCSVVRSRGPPKGEGDYVENPTTLVLSTFIL